MISPNGRGETVICWQCLGAPDNPLHDPAAHDSCPPWCTHHTFEYEPKSRSELLTHVGALLSEISNLRAELLGIAGPLCPHDNTRAIVHRFWNGELIQRAQMHLVCAFELKGKLCARVRDSTATFHTRHGQRTKHDPVESWETMENHRYRVSGILHPPTPIIEQWLQRSHL